MSAFFDSLLIIGPDWLRSASLLPWYSPEVLSMAKEGDNSFWDFLSNATFLIVK